MAPGPTRNPGANRRSLWGHFVLGCAIAVQLLVATGYARFFAAPSTGFMLIGISAAADEFEAVPVTLAAAEVAPPGPANQRLAAINGQRLSDLPPGEPLGPAARRLLRVEPGATNTFALATASGVREVTLPLERPSLGVWLRLPGVYSELVGLVYLLAGVLVFWQRQPDRAALPLVTFSAIGSVQMAFPAAAVWFDDPVCLAAVPVLPLYGTAGFQLALAFTGYHQHRRAQLAAWALMIASAALAAELSVAHVAMTLGHVDWEPLLHAGLMVTGAHLVLAIVAIVGICWRAMRPPHPLGLRRRAAVLARATLIAFTLPSAYLAIAPLVGPRVSGVMSVAMPITMATFPVFIGYAIVRHRMFDLRIVVRQGVVYGALSLLVTLSYLGVVLAAVRVVGRHSEEPVFSALLAGALVLGASVLKVKVQQAVDRVVFRSRYVYAEALSRASAALAQARSTEAIVETMREALVTGMQLSRAYVALGDGRGDGRLLTFVLGSTPDPGTGRLPPELPRTLDVAQFEPIERVFSTGHVATAFDSRAASAQATHTLAQALASGLLEPGSGFVDARHGEDTFWSDFCIEQIVPVRVGDARTAARVVGLLLLGPRQDERPFDPEDERLLATLANQLAVALENARAFEEIARLTAGLESEVLARTRELREALDTLGRAQVTLMESQKQALLGRLAAGILHEVNSPLGALQSAADTIRRSVDRARDHLATCHADEPDAARALRALGSSAELTAVIESGSARIGALVTSLAAFVSLDQAEIRRTDVRQGIESALTLLGPRLGDGVVLRRSLGELPLPVHCSPARLNQVFLNLLENAVTAVTPRGCVEIVATAMDHQIVVTVADDGPGIPADQLHRVFDFSFTTKASGRVGLGLGLPASRRVVEESGGTLSLEPAPGGGTVARVVLPRAENHPSTPAPPPGR